MLEALGKGISLLAAATKVAQVCQSAVHIRPIISDAYPDALGSGPRQTFQP